MAIPFTPIQGAEAALSLGGFAFSSVAKAVAGLYGVASDINDFLDKHIQEMQTSANSTIATTGRILEMAKYGFGLGYLSSVTIIAVGQFLLGNTLSAMATVATAATLSNPIAMTCGAVGAILYGWGALRDEEKNAMLDQLARGLDIGVELIRSIISFVINTAKDLLSSQALKDFKAFISDKAAVFGRSLSDVTHQTVDVMNDAAASVKKRAELAIAGTVKVTSDASAKLGDSLSDFSKTAGHAIEQTGEAAKQVMESGKAAVQRVRGQNSGNTKP
ncbi:hypothetical protein LNV09_20560 [Paucibacter sp. B2R-40]|uniref:hypothetical protein n=1 Tax=Paucibacter sp. B2R-40 TaxID=2893554 RepID=UPI0021E3F054|nr:hypothetical protein [Paucibacter sp. B2R-40]MCV2356540.1 hypothetical protein [Paucibacter sp. B2R-40]